MTTFTIVAFVVLIVAVCAIIVWVADLKGQFYSARSSYEEDAKLVCGDLEELQESRRIIADEVRALRAAAQDEQKLQLELAGGGVWQTQGGHKLRIRDMSTNHLQNTLKLFRTRAGNEPFLSMSKELARREEDNMWKNRGKEAVNAAVDKQIRDNEIAAIQRLAQRLVDTKKVFTKKERKEWADRMADVISFLQQEDSK